MAGLEKIGVRAVVEGLEKYISDLSRVQTSTDNATKKVSASVMQLSNASSSFTGASKGVVSASTNLNMGLGGLANKAGASAVSLTSLASAAGIIIPLLAAAGKAALAAANYTRDYGLAVGDMAAKLGISAQEASRFIQIADDLRIDQSAMTVGFRNLVDNGIQPTLSNIKLLAAQYQALRDPVARAQFAMDKFGMRAGLEMQKLLQASATELDAMAASAEHAGLVMDAQGVQKAKDYYKALDTLKDAWNGLKVRMGTPIIGSIVVALRVISEGLGITPTGGEQAAADEEALRARGLGMGRPGQATPEQQKTLLAARQQALAEIETGRRLVRDEELRRSVTFQLREQVDYSRQIADYTRMQEATQVSLAGAQRQYQQASQEALGVAQENLGIINSLTSEGSNRQIQDAKLIDQVYGTNYAKDIERKKAEEKMWRDFHAGRITEAQVEEQLAAQKSTIMDPAIAALKDAEAETVRFQDAINALKGTTVYITQVCRGYGCPTRSVVGQTSINAYEQQNPTGTEVGGPLTGANIVGEGGWEAIINGMVIPHAMSVAMAAAGALRPKAKHAAGGFIDPASLAFPLSQVGSGQGSRVGIGQMNVAISADIERQAFLSALARAVQ